MQSRNLGSEFFYLHIVNVLKASKSQAVVNLLALLYSTAEQQPIPVYQSDKFLNIEM